MAGSIKIFRFIEKLHFVTILKNNKIPYAYCIVQCGLGMAYVEMCFFYIMERISYEYRSSFVSQSVLSLMSTAIMAGSIEVSQLIQKVHHSIGIHPPQPNKTQRSIQLSA